MDADLAAQRLCRLRSVMCDTAVEFVLTVDPINITYATGLWNMNVFSMMGATRFLLIAAEGPIIMWEYVGAEHLAEGLSTIDEVRPAPGVTALSGPPYRDACCAFADELAAACHASATDRVQLAVERMRVGFGDDADRCPSGVTQHQRPRRLVRERGMETVRALLLLERPVPQTGPTLDAEIAQLSGRRAHLVFV